MALTPVIRTISFAKERDPSIDKMMQKMENQNPSHKRIFQKLPKHLRRRAMSYDIRKIPKSMRAGVEEQVRGAAEAKQRNKPSGRDPSKFREHGTALAVHRNREFRWLESHLWHAKRFHMQDLWGWKIPIAPTMKQTRNLIKMTKESCTMRDISFMVIISLKGEHSLLHSRVAELMRTGARIEVQRRVLFSAELFRPLLYPTAPIGPAELFWIDENHIWIITHPLLRGQLVNALQGLNNNKEDLNSGENVDNRIVNEGIEIEVIDGELNMYEVYGPGSTDAIRSVLVPSEQTSPDVARIISGLPDPSAVPPGTSIAYTASDPRTICDLYKSKEGSSTSTTNTTTNINASNTTTINNGQTMMVDLALLDEKMTPKICDSSLFDDRALVLKSDEEFNTERSKLLFPMAEGPSGSVPVLLMQRPASVAHGFGACWLVLVPFGCGSIVFRALVRHGCRVFGLECARLVDLEAGRFNFPFDRPDTNDGLQIMTKEMMEMTRANDARPPGKRRALDFFQFPDDFYIAAREDCAEAFVRIGIKMVKRGTPSRFATLYIPEAEDYLLVTAVGTNARNEGKEEDGRRCEIRGDRRPIGMVLNGNSSLLAGDGRGIGIVMAQAFAHFLPECERSNNFTFKQRPKQSYLAVVREQGSQFLHLAWIWLHTSNFYP